MADGIRKNRDGSIEYKQPNGTWSKTKPAPTSNTAASKLKTQKAPEGADDFTKATYDAANAVGDDGLAKSMIGSIAYGNDLLKALSANKLDESLDPNIKASLEKANANVDLLSKGFDPETLAIIDSMKSGLGGYTAPELEAQRSQGLSSILSQSQSSTNDLMGALGARNLQGGIAAKLGLGIADQAIRGRADLESKLLADNAAVQDARKTALGNFVNGANTTLNGAKAAAFQNLTSNANNAATFVQNAKVTNLNNLNSAIEKQYATPFAFGQLYETNQGRKDTKDYYDKSIAATNKSLGGGGRSNGSGRSSNGGSSNGSSSGFQNSGLN